MTFSNIMIDWLSSKEFDVKFKFDFANESCFFIRSTKYEELMGWLYDEEFYIASDGTYITLQPSNPNFFDNVEMYINNWRPNDHIERYI